MSEKELRDIGDQIFDLEMEVDEVKDSFRKLLAPHQLHGAFPVFVSLPITGEIASGSVTNGKCGGNDAGTANIRIGTDGRYQLTVSAAKGSCPFVVTGTPLPVQPGGNGGDSHSWTFTSVRGASIGISCTGEGNNHSCNFTYSLIRTGAVRSSADDWITGTVAEGVVDGACGSSKATVQVPRINGDYQLTISNQGVCDVQAGTSASGIKPRGRAFRFGPRAGNSASRSFRRTGTRLAAIDIECGGSGGDCKFTWKLVRLSDPI